MFTGIIERVGVIAHTRQTAGGRRLCIRVGPSAAECALGDSICVNGVCLTVASRSADLLEFDVIRETLDKTTLGRLRAGRRVNIERSLRLGDRLDGHFVQGHVDGAASVDRVLASPHEHVVWLRPQPHLTPYIVAKGSIAIDGVSLTIAETTGGTFSVALIPSTLERTTLGELHPGDRVNLETDIITRTIVHRLDQLAGPSELRAQARGHGVRCDPDAPASPSPFQGEGRGEGTGSQRSTTLTLESLQKAGFA